MGSFGESLRREREMRGVTIQEIASSTKINPRLLQAIEADDFSRLPGGIFTRSFIRAYAGYLGLDEERVMAEFQLVAPREDLDVHRLGVKKRSAGKPGGAGAGVASAIVAALLLAGGYALYRHSHPAAPDFELNPGATAPASPPTASSEVASAPAGSPSPPSAAATSKAGAAPGILTAAGQAAPSSPTTLPVLGEGDLTLQVATTERVWLAVAADGKTLLEKTLDPNVVETFRAHTDFDLVTGNAQGVILTLNGETLKPLGRFGEVRKIHLTKAGIQNPAPRGTDHSQDTP